MSWKKIL